MMTAYKTNLASIWTGNKQKEKSWFLYVSDLDLSETSGGKKKVFQKLKGGTQKHTNTERAYSAAFHMKEIKFVQGLLWHLAHIPPQQINRSCTIRSPKAFCEITVISERLHSTDPKIKILKLPCGGTLEGPLHSHLYWREMQSSLQDTWNGPPLY